MMKSVGAVVVALCLTLGLRAGTEAPKTAKAVKATGMAAKLEQLAYAMLPEEKLNRAMGFFGPVTKKYLPVFNQFQREYNAAEKKLPVIAKYAPQAEYEAEKAEYLDMAGGFVMMLKMPMRPYSSSQTATEK